MMERMRSYLEGRGLRLPSLQALRDGSFWRAQEKEAEPSFSYLKEFEVKLVQAQEVALWSSPITSLAWLLASQLLVWHLTTSPLLPNLAKLALAAFLYSTWVYRLWPAIRVPPEHPEDPEPWTPLHPDLLSAPELGSWVRGTRERIGQVVTGQQLLRQEQPGRSCLLSCLLCLLLAVLGLHTSTALLLHTACLLAVTLPALLVRAHKSPHLSPLLQTLAEVLGGLGDLVIYRGLSAPPLENKDLDEFVPEETGETASYLERALSCVRREQEQEDVSLTPRGAIPGHEEVELESSQLSGPDTSLLPLTFSSSGDLLDSDEEEDDLLPGGGMLAQGLEEEEESEDSCDLEPPVGPVYRLVTSSVTGVTATVSSVSATVSSATSALLGSLLTPSTMLKNDSEPDLEDFELVDESDLDLLSP